MEKFPGDSDLAARIATYELAGRMQMSIPEVTDLKREPKKILEEYGATSSDKIKSGYARNCILARRLLESGVRVVQLFNGATTPNGINNWDSHKDIHKTALGATDSVEWEYTENTIELINKLKEQKRNK